MKTRRDFLSKGLMAAGGIVLSPTLLAQANSEVVSKQLDLPSLKGRKVLFTYGGWDGHEPKKFRDFMLPWLKDEGATVEAQDNLSPYTDVDLMKEMDLVIQIFTMSQITNEQEKGLLEAVKNGTGMAGWHGGMCDAFRSNVAYQYMTGGQWVAHPGGVIDYSVNVINKKDPISSGLKDFKMTSEQYFMHVDPNVKVLATTTFNGSNDFWIDGCVMPVAWKKMFGKGRIFYTSLGHNLDHVTSVPEALALTQRGIKWASASKYLAAEKWVSPAYDKD
ncbi:ThuA domain-containing protein [Reichenbachiella ulvae]|uniref:ThuA domain-containing protein n=1 Tax=Reichenbachiella ulvae TaxID=2980104 RepID=A0ABT3CYN3_9BACT|nr:ThuA domain-containing protein [Reichenbachiella ulvae]MCV9388732.1 ThuA domain-containing protein [Reichenbachiella ulvae]